MEKLTKAQREIVDKLKDGCRLEKHVGPSGRPSLIHPQGFTFKCSEKVLVSLCKKQLLVGRLEWPYMKYALAPLPLPNVAE